MVLSCSYVIDDTTSIFLLNDGALAGDVKDFLVKQDRCLEVGIDKDKFPGRGALLQKEQEQKEQNKDKSKKEL